MHPAFRSLRPLLLAVVLAGPALAQEDAGAERFPVEPCQDFDVDALRFAGRRFGVILAASEDRRASLGGEEFGPRRTIVLDGIEVELRLDGDDLVLAKEGAKDQRVRRAQTVEIATPLGLAKLSAYPYRAALPGTLSSGSGGPRGSSREATTVQHWLVHRPQARTVHLGQASLSFLDADLDGRFDGFGKDFFVPPDSEVAVRLSRRWLQGEAWKTLAFDEEGDELLLGDETPETLAFDPLDAAGLPAPARDLLLRDAQGSELLLPGPLRACELPLGTWRFVAARVGEGFEALAPNVDTSGRGRVTGGSSTTGWFELRAPSAEKDADGAEPEPATPTPSWGAPFRIHPIGDGFRDPENPTGASTSASSGGRRIFHLDALLVRGAAGEVWDRLRRGPAARAAGIASFPDARCRIGSVDDRGKAGKTENWSFEKNGAYTSPFTVSDRTVAFTLEVEVKGFGKWKREVPLGAN